MSEQFFTSGGWRCKRRRCWKKQALLIAAAALVAWLLSGCEMRGEPPVWLSGAVLGLVVFGTMIVVPCVVWQLRRKDVEAWDSALVSGEILLIEDPLGLPWGGMTRADLRRIVLALGEEAREVRAIVRIMESTPDEAAQAQLRENAKHRLGGMRVCLMNLAAELEEPERPGSPSHEGRVQS